MATLEQVLAIVQNTDEKVEKIEEHLKELNGSVRQNTTDVAVLKDWRKSQAQPAVTGVQDLRVEIAKYTALGGGIGVVVSIIGVVLKALGVF
jgi:archaellum component FlaC